MDEDEKKLSNIRNIGIMAHIDAGKTTTTERILYVSGKKHKVGGVDTGDTTTDYDPQERKRGITIFSAAVTVHWKSKDGQQNHQINIIDTPGHVDFTAEVERSLRVLDGGIVVMDGKKGVEAQTETVWRQANKYQIPRLIFVNKMDSVDNEEKFDECLKSIREKLGAVPLAIQFPIGAGSGLKGVVDIVEQKAYYFKLGEKEENYQVKEIPQPLLEKTQEFRQALVEKIIDHDEELAMKYLEGQELSVAEIKKLLRQATLTGKYFPTLCGSAYKHVGVKLILDGVVDYLPSPLDIKEIPVCSPNDKNKEEMVNCNSPLSCLALAFKIVVDSYNNKLTFFRVYAGKITANSYVYNVNQDKRERISRLVRLHADDKEEIKEVGAGDIAAAIGLEQTVTGDTIGEEKKPLLLESINFAEPVISQAIEPKNNESRDKLHSALEKLKIQDPSFKYWIDKEGRQMIIAGMGELHLEILVERLRSEFKVELEKKQQKVSYRETIKEEFEVNEKGERELKKTAIEYTHRKQTGGAGQYAKIELKFRPNPGGGFKFINSLKGERVGRGNCYVPAIKKGLQAAFSDGPLLGYPVVDVEVSLIDGGYHPVDSSDLAFETAGRDAFVKNSDKFKLTLLEPIMQIEVAVPKDYMGDILANLTSRRAIIENTEIREDGSYISGKAPLREILNYSTTLREITKGRGDCSTHLSHYQEVPTNILEEILKEEKL